MDNIFCVNDIINFYVGDSAFCCHYSLQRQKVDFSEVDLLNRLIIATGDDRPTLKIM